MKQLKNQECLGKELNEGYNESNRKTRAFYITLGTVVALFMGNGWWGNANDVIDAIIQLSSIYIGGLALTDSVRYHKFGSKTLENPEKVRGTSMTAKELEERYGDK